MRELGEQHWQGCTMTPDGILETVLYAKDLAAIEGFYRDVLGMEPFAKAEGRHLFYRCGGPAASRCC